MDEVPMFQSLDEQIRADENREGSPAGRMAMYALYAIAGLMVCFAVVYSIHLIG